MFLARDPTLIPNNMLKPPIRQTSKAEFRGFLLTRAAFNQPRAKRPRRDEMMTAKIIEFMGKSMTAVRGIRPAVK